MTLLKTCGLAILCAFAFAGTALAANTPAPLTGGTIHIKFRVADDNPDALPTASISVRRLDDLTQVYCQDVVDVGGVMMVEGDTAIIANDAAQVLLEGVSWSDPACGGVASLGSLDTYQVIFAVPGQPVMIPF